MLWQVLPPYSTHAFVRQRLLQDAGACTACGDGAAGMPFQYDHHQPMRVEVCSKQGAWGVLGEGGGAGCEMRWVHAQVVHPSTCLLLQYWCLSSCAPGASLLGAPQPGGSKTSCAKN